MDITKAKANLLENKWIYYCSVLAGTIFLYLVILFCIDAYPFGDRTLVYFDAKAQFIEFYAYMRSLITESNNLLYSFSIGLGGNMISLFAYYLACPFYIIFLFVSKVQLIPAIHIVIMLLFVSCSFSFSILLRNAFHIQNIYAVIASVSYAFIGFNVAYLPALTWLSGVALLPLITLGLWKLIHFQKSILYTLSLGLAILCNFYIGYMLCITAVLFYFAICFMNQNPKKYIGRSIVPFFTHSLLAGGLSGILTIPTALSMLTSRINAVETKFTLNSTMKPLDLIYKYFTGATDALELLYGTPQIFIGVLLTVNVLLYFANAAYSKREKNICLILFVIFIASFYINPLNLVWHCFNANAGFNYRYSFIFSFILLLISVRNLSALEQIKKGPAIFLSTAAVLISIFVYVTSEEKLDKFNITFDLEIIFLFLLMLTVYGKSKIRKLFPIVLCLLQVADIGFNTTFTWVDCNMKYRGLFYSDFQKANELVEAEMDFLNSYDNSFYRMERVNAQELSDPMTYNYYGVSHFGSTVSKNAQDIMKHMGYWQCFAKSSYGEGATAGADNLMGIRYIFSNKELDSEKYRLVHSFESENLYQNTQALGMTTAAEQLIQSETEEINPFEYQNLYWKCLDTDSQKIYTPVSHSAYRLKDYGVAEKTDKVSGKFDSAEADTRSYSLITTLSIEREEAVYLWKDGTWDILNALYVNGVEYPLSDVYRGVIRLNPFEIGEKVEIEVNFLIPLDDNKSDLLDLRENPDTVTDMEIYYENEALVSQYSESAAEKQGTLEMVSNSKLSGTIEFPDKNGYMLCAIPYDSGWTVYVDGEKTETCKALSALLAVPMQQGIHTFTMTYCPPGLKEGIMCTSLSAFLLLLFLYGEKKQL